MIFAAGLGTPVFAAEPTPVKMLGPWVDHVHGATEWVFELHYDGTFIGDRRQGLDHMEGKFFVKDTLITFRWKTLEGDTEEAWGRLIQMDGNTLHFRFSPVLRQLAQAPLLQLVRPGQQAELYTDAQIEDEQVETQPLIRVFTTSGRRYTGVIVEETTMYIMLETKRDTHKIKRKHIERIEKAMATHAQ